MDFSSVVDSRDIEERIDELEAERQDLVDIHEEAYSDLEDVDPEEDDTDEREALKEAVEALQEWDTEHKEELDGFLNLRDDVNSPEWSYGLGLINEDYFTEYCEELCKDIGAVPQDVPDYIAIDWEETAENLKVDYSSVEYDGNTFYYRDC